MQINGQFFIASGQSSAMRMKSIEPVFVTELFCQIHAELLSLLSNLSGDDWVKPTAARQWVVKDIAAHLLDGDIRRLSYQRDKAPMVAPETPGSPSSTAPSSTAPSSTAPSSTAPSSTAPSSTAPSSTAPSSTAPSSTDGYRELVDFLNQLNADWIRAAKRISPGLLIEFLEVTGAQVCELFRTLDPFAPALFGVAWAGEQESQNWFDIAREYTEKWHHQQQIRDAVGAPPLTGRKWLFPVLDTFLRGLPHTYRDTQAEEGSSVVFIITGEAGGEWTLKRESGAWKLYAGESDTAVCLVRMEQDAAWRLLTKGLSQEEAAERVEISGDDRLGMPILGMLAVMA